MKSSISSPVDPHPTPIVLVQSPDKNGRITAAGTTGGKICAKKSADRMIHYGNL